MNNRLYYLDKLRVFLTALVIVHHTAITYGAGGSWYYEVVDKTEITASIVLLTMFTAINQAFFMGLFFFLSAYFTPSSYDRKGASKFLADRFLRLGVPLLVFQFSLGPFVAFISGRTGYDSFQAFYVDNVLSFRQLHIGPLWFVETLLYFAVVYVLWRKLFLPTTGGTHNLTLTPPPNNRTLLIAAALLGLAAFAVRLVFPTGTDVLGMQLGYFPMYIALMIAGVAARRSDWLAQLTPKQVRLWFRISLAAIPVLPIALILTGALDGNLQFEGGLNLQAFVYAMWEPFVGFGIILFLLRWFSGKNDAPSPVQRAAGESAYTAYIIHPLIVVPLSMLLNLTPLHPNFAFVLVSTAAVFLCFAAGWLIRAIPGANRIL